ncbi:hypothetical protein E4T44_04041 [Aureobasidium sp. EXF-8845]|nr:hypothetical protein E4T44_04041 [Aureobasidium sp. EXF-8845]KAI4854264.1 hypothetical protein E4T45_04030 [Aureobasidium sp. EXF-8846]
MVTLPGRTSNEQTEQLRKTRAWLIDNIRNDWSYPNAPHVLPDYYDPSQAAPGASTSLVSPVPTQDAITQINEHIRNRITISATQPTGKPPIDSRERYYSDGENSGSDNENDDTGFSTPDSVGAELRDRKARRIQRRQQRFADELHENIGLAHWSAQRNTWTGARPRTHADHDSSASGVESSGHPSPVTLVSLASTPPIIPTTLTGATPDTDMMIPVAPPLLPDNAVRNRITTNTYSDIYTKIVLQSRTPSIPINLTDVTRSLVHGWKEEGQWPPKPTPAEPSLVKKHGHPHIKGGLNKLGRVLGLRGQGLPVEKGPAQDDYEKQKPAYMRRLRRRARAAAQGPPPDLYPDRSRPILTVRNNTGYNKPRYTADDDTASTYAQAATTPGAWQKVMIKAVKSKYLEKKWRHSTERKLLWCCEKKNWVEFQKPYEERRRKSLPLSQTGYLFDAGA